MMKHLARMIVLAAFLAVMTHDVHEMLQASAAVKGAL